MGDKAIYSDKGLKLRIQYNNTSVNIGNNFCTKILR